MFVLVIFSIRVRVDVNILQMRSLIENEIIFCSLQTSFPLSISRNFSSIKKTWIIWLTPVCPLQWFHGGHMVPCALLYNFHLSIPASIRFHHLAAIVSQVVSCQWPGRCSFCRKPVVHPGLSPSLARTTCRDLETVIGPQSPLLTLSSDIPLCLAFGILLLTPFQR